MQPLKEVAESLSSTEVSEPKTTAGMVSEVHASVFFACENLKNNQL